MKNNNFILEAIIEIPKNSKVKYEFDKEKNIILVDRFLYGTHVYPGNYGYIDKTLELDGDPIDIVVVSSHSVFPGTHMKVKVIGAVKMIDDGKSDNKLIAIFVGDPQYKDINHYSEFTGNLCEKIVDFFQNYKNLEKKTTIIEGWISPQEAIELVNKAKKRWLNKKS